MTSMRSKHLLNTYTPNDKLGTVPECDESEERPHTLLSLLALATAFLLLVAAGALHYTSLPSARLYRADQFGFVHPVHPAHAYKWEREYKILPNGDDGRGAAGIPPTEDAGVPARDIGALSAGPGLTVQSQHVELDNASDGVVLVDVPKPHPRREAPLGR